MDNMRPTMTDEEMLNDYPRLKLEYTRLHEDYRRLQTEKDKQLLLHNVSQQRELLEWLSDEDYFNISRDEISEILEDWQTYNSNCG
jgi:hypothetical protein